MQELEYFVILSSASLHMKEVDWIPYLQPIHSKFVPLLLKRYPYTSPIFTCITAYGNTPTKVVGVLKMAWSGLLLYKWALALYMNCGALQSNKNNWLS